MHCGEYSLTGKTPDCGSGELGSSPSIHPFLILITVLCIFEIGISA